MHDYGTTRQLGHGQDLAEYLEDLARILQSCADVSADDATLWVVVGTIRRAGTLVQLPALLAERAAESGWGLREEITWDKGKALPWTTHGELRDVTERVLLFSKTSDFLFNPTEIQSPIPNSEWWRRYPERYSPNGRLPTNIWAIGIPTQGSWTGVRSHFCPFPPELTHAMLSLTTEPGDVVLDPFAGIGSVPAMADAMGRIGVGVELSEDYARQYDRTLQEASEYTDSIVSDQSGRKLFRETILELRLLKFARILGGRLCDQGVGVDWIRVRKSARRPRGPFAVVTADFEIALSAGGNLLATAELANAIAGRRPLSKFGVEARFAATQSTDAAASGHWYRGGRFWLPPVRKRPVAGGPHVVASFVPRLDAIDDMPAK